MAGSSFSRHRGFLRALGLGHFHRLLARRLLRDEVGELHRVEVLVHLVVQRGPQVVRHAALLVLAVLLAATLRRVERLVDRGDDVGDRHLRKVARERVAAAGAANALDQRVAAQLAEQLLEIRKRDALPLADAGERDGPLAAVHREVEHRGHGEPSLGGQSHRLLQGFNTRENRSTILNPTNTVNYYSPTTLRSPQRVADKALSFSAFRDSSSFRINSIRLSMSTL